MCVCLRLCARISFYGLTTVYSRCIKFHYKPTIQWQCDKPQSKYETTNLIINPLTRTSVSFQKKSERIKKGTENERHFSLIIACTSAMLQSFECQCVWFQFSSIFFFAFILVHFHCLHIFVFKSAHFFDILSLWLNFGFPFCLDSKPERKH